MHWILKFILEWKSTCFGQFLCQSSGVFHRTHSNGMSHIGFVDSFRAGSGCSIPILSETWRVLFENKFENLVHLVGFIIRISHDARSRERKNKPDSAVSESRRPKYELL
jgi:hypothetical protein